jgi:hypothetical protein
MWFYNLIKLKFFFNLYQWVKPRFFGFAILIISIFLIIYIHSEYISWLELSGNKTYLTKSYILKNFLIVLALIVFIFLNRNKTIPSIKKDYKTIKAEKIKMEEKKDNLKVIKEKGELKTEYERILEGSDEDDK